MRILLEPKTVALNMACLQHDVIMLKIDVSCTLAESAQTGGVRRHPRTEASPVGSRTREGGLTDACLDSHVAFAEGLLLGAEEHRVVHKCLWRHDVLSDRRVTHLRVCAHVHRGRDIGARDPGHRALGLRAQQQTRRLRGRLAGSQHRGCRATELLRLAHTPDSPNLEAESY